jgi:23S rRNA (cytosine1962-C5)-methyltransferase
MDDLATRLDLALAVRSQQLHAKHHSALRLFAGFYEGFPDLIADLYASTLVLFDYSKDEQVGGDNLKFAKDFYISKLPWMECVVQKTRHSRDLKNRRGVIKYGDMPATKIMENGITYAINLMMNQDASFYFDTRNLRSWLFENAAGWQVLNTFAYTGSLGIAALAGGAAHVIQVDRNKKFLGLARRSAIENHFDLGKMKLRGSDFFNEVAHFKRENILFDCLILDPPFFSSTSKGTVDLVSQSTRLINKVRPLIKDGGWLVAINNALFLSGTDYFKSLDSLCQDGYLSIEQTIPIPQDITGFPETTIYDPPADPTPFNHSTKIVILKVKRK